LLELRSFDICKNVIAPMIAILDCLEFDIEISDAGMETAESDDYRGMLRNDRDVNGVLATT